MVTNSPAGFNAAYVIFTSRRYNLTGYQVYRFNRYGGGTMMASTPLNDGEITERLAQLSGWQRSGDTITKTFKMNSYMAGLVFASAIGTIAEGMDHHPDMHIGWKKVTVSYSTHDAGNKITDKDFNAAAAIEALPYKPEF